MLKQLILFLFCLISTTAFSQEPNEDSLLVSLKRTACFGKCPIYSVSVLNNGSVSFHGEKFTSTLGVTEYKISQESVRAIQAELKRIHFSKFSSEYTPGSWGCFSYATDHPSIIIKATIKSKEKSVMAYLGCSSKKIEALYSLSQFIDNILETSNLIKGQTQKAP